MKCAKRETNVPWRMHVLRVAGVFWCVWGAAMWSGVAYGHDLRVGTRTQLVTTAKSTGTLVHIDGYLRDNLNQGVEGEMIRVDLKRVDRSSGPISRDVRTDRLGRYHVSLHLPPGLYQGVVRYAGRQYYYDAVQRDIDQLRTESAEVELKVQLPSVVMRSQQTVAVSITATSQGQPVRGLPLKAIQSGETEKELKGLRTGRDGSISFPVNLNEIKGPTLKIDVRFKGSEGFYEARDEAKSRVLATPTLTLDASVVRARLQRGVLARGKLSDEYGQIQGFGVDVIASQDTTELGRYRAKTNSDGEYEVFLSEDQYKGGKLTLTAQAALPGGGLLNAPEVLLDAQKTSLGFAPWLLAIGVVLAVAAAIFPPLLSWWRRKPFVKKRKLAQAVRRSHAAREPVLETVAELPSTPRSISDAFDSINGVLEDALTGQAIEKGAVVLIRADLPKDPASVRDATPESSECVSDAQGLFELHNLPHGSWKLRAMCNGYITATSTVTLPHTGQLRFVRFVMTPVRKVVRDLYTSLVEAVLHNRDAWGVQTPRQTAALLVECVEAILEEDGYAGPGDGFAVFQTRLEKAAMQSSQQLSSEEMVSTLIALVEEVYYSERAHDEAILEITERLVREVQARASGMTRRAPPSGATSQDLWAEFDVPAPVGQEDV